MVVGSVSATLRQEFPTAVSPARSIPPSANRKRLRSKLRVFHSVRGEFGPWDHPFTTADGWVASPMFGLGRVGSGCKPVGDDAARHGLARIVHHHMAGDRPVCVLQIPSPPLRARRPDDLAGWWIGCSTSIRRGVKRASRIARRRLAHPTASAGATAPSSAKAATRAAALSTASSRPGFTSSPCAATRRGSRWRAPKRRPAQPPWPWAGSSASPRARRACPRARRRTRRAHGPCRRD